LLSVKPLAGEFVEVTEHPLFEALVRSLLGAACGTCVGLLLLGVGALRAVLALLGGADVSMDGLWPELGIYVLGFAAGGAVMAALWPTQPVRARRYLAGAVGGIVVMAAVARMVDGPGITWTLSRGLFVAGVGSILALGFTRGLLGPPAA
jgi:hypothetical protein